MHHLAGHPNVIQIVGAYEDVVVVHVVMELCAGGEWILSEGKATEITKISPVGGVVSILLVASIPMLVYSLLKQIGIAPGDGTFCFWFRG